MNCLSLVQGFFIYPFTFGVLGCEEASRGKRCALPSRNSRKSHGEVRWTRAEETWVHVAPKHGSQALCSVQTRRALLREPVVQDELVGFAVYQ